MYREDATDKKGYCVCGKLLTMCREDCCDATLYALQGAWVGTPWNYRDYDDADYFDDPVETFEAYYDIDDDGRGCDFGVWNEKGHTFEGVVGFVYEPRLPDTCHLIDSRLWQMMVFLGGAWSIGKRRKLWAAPCDPISCHTDFDIRGDTPGDAVINAYSIMVDKRTM